MKQVEGHFFRWTLLYLWMLFALCAWIVYGFTANEPQTMEHVPDRELVELAYSGKGAGTEEVEVAWQRNIPDRHPCRTVAYQPASVTREHEGYLQVFVRVPEAGQNHKVVVLYVLR